MRNEFVFFSIVSLLLVFGIYQYIWPPVIWSLIVLLPILLLGYYDMLQSRHAIMRNFPILGRGRYIFEELRPKIYQYFIESETDGTPIPRMLRSIVYQRAKNEISTTPFGTQLDVYRVGYEWITHSIGAIPINELNPHPRVRVGGKDCMQPYELSIFNVSAMSYGSLSNRAILSLNGGAQKAGFAHNTGEGGISPYHITPGGDLIFQFGTGYFGCRDEKGNFDPLLFKDKAEMDNVKMIEIKLSQGAKPGHGGLLPATKNTEEIARIRHILPGIAVHSPAYHTAFDSPVGLLEFVQELRDLSLGKPVGFKLCVGRPSEFIAICKAMLETGILPDFISVDGGEGGTGAAPLEYTNSMGMPLLEGLTFVHDMLRGFGLRDEIRLLVSGKIMTGFGIYRAMALGADACYSARGMMFALGCIQALECHKNTCPTGVATQDKELVAGLKVKDKTERVANFHLNTVSKFVELLGSSGKRTPSDILRKDVFRRINTYEVKSFETMYPTTPYGSFKYGEIPERWKSEFDYARIDSFA
ncbi:FMN-binding glutamate synthase family protein [Membranicola marinus]|uniref:FMN-binding glutamate synthase family protein n=1 Tax=Membranihabitans marinus TaxID=1227546 RepID=A0A953HPJ9_9BACT|nr:FMN-binding glutamate synthase family protein [Membranihabitans marinus]MBY5958463.1 FMN-binding glutamate synthase family protein [Membranihabitans marinus]